MNKGISAEIIEGECYGSYHWWVECRENILDLSIKQFESLAQKSLPCIFIKKIDTADQYERLRKVDSFISV